jgi:hypothetical protein
VARLGFAEKQKVVHAQKKSRLHKKEAHAGPLETDL